MNYRDGIFQVKYNNVYEQINFETIASQVKFNHNINDVDTETDTQDILDKIIDLNLDTQLQLKYGMKGNGVTDETALLQKALNENDVVYIPKELTIGIGSTIKITGSKKILSNGGTLKCLTNGLDNIFSITNSKDIVISGINFDMALKGRTSIDIKTTTGYLIENCSFTGFTAQYGYYQTDGGLRVDSSTGGIISHNTWFNHGNQYGTATNTLNRCIGIGQKSDNTLIIGNIFKSVNQAIVTDSSNIRVTNNHFEDVKDNGLYLVGTSENIIIEGNTFKNSVDECIVLSGVGAFVIDNNVFDEVGNKVIAINSSLTNVSITDNIVKCNSKAPANIISWRSEGGALKNATITNFMITGNTFEVTPVITNLQFHFGDIDGGICENNYFKFNTTSTLLMRFESKTNLKWIFRNNTLDNTASTTTANLIAFTGTTATNRSFIIDSCKISGRISKPDWVSAKNMKIQVIENIIYLVGMVETNILWNTGATAPTTGTWNIGDIIYSTQPSAGGHIGWVYTTAKVWKPFGPINN